MHPLWLFGVPNGGSKDPTEVSDWSLTTQVDGPRFHTLRRCGDALERTGKKGIRLHEK